MRFVHLLLCMMLLQFASEASSSTAVSPLVCVPNKEYTNNYEPLEFNKTNNLLRKPGYEPLYCGQKILLNLEILDKNCVPLSDTKVYIWQVSCDKKYPYKPLRNKIDQALIKITPGSSFLGSGSSMTNNLGLTNFITIYPPALDNEESHINLRVEHQDYGTFQTKIFLKNYNLIQDDEYDIFKIRIVTPWENLFRRY